VVEAYCGAGDFVPNDIHIDAEKESFALVTGPNMAGKSTFLRQTALIVLMAQIGSFVPADEAGIGIVDRLFCRVGASDNLARGESTFLVEMNETANILRRASQASLIIMDEVGRGTSTDDGLAIAQAVSEYILNKVKSRTLFATHFHELSAIEHKRFFNLSLSIVEDRGEIIFLKKVVKGPSNRSYGLHVARLAGLPDIVISRAGEILDTLFSGTETGRADIKSKGIKEGLVGIEQKDLFSPQQIVIDKLISYDLNSHSPIETVNFLNQLKKDLKS
jgi:DNA mismatch repair protein MutS